jgi:PKD repeat protein
MIQNRKLTRLSLAIAVCLITTANAYDAGWTRTDCSTYSYNGLYERYVYAANLGWINNNKWDDPAIEGVDCSAYVSRCLALPDYVAENQKAGYPYSTYQLFNGVDNTVRIYSIYDLQPWDLWVWRAEYGGPSPGHAGLFKQFSGSYIVTREAVNESTGVVERNRRIQDMIDWGSRYYRRANWAGGTVVTAPTVTTNVAANILDTSATLSGTITDDGGASISSRGFAWGTTTDCSSGWVNAATVSNGTFTAVLSGLAPERRYYFQARAQNSAGWGSGLVRSFTTAAAPTGPQIIIDNGKSGTSYTGTWGVSDGPNPYGTNSLWARDGATYTWRMSSQPAGVYEVSMWWTQYSSRGNAIPVAIDHASGTAQTTVNQQINGGKWNVLGQYYFNGSGSVTLTANRSYPTSHCADAVRFVLMESNQPPVAVIDSISPQSAQTGQQVTFTGHGTDDGTITAYQWVSSIDGLLGTTATVKTSSLSAGTHVISFRVRDNQSVWSETVEASVTITKPDEPVSNEIIIDNSTAGTSYTGYWQASGAAGPWGANSLWSRDGATYSWNTSSLTPGLYEVFMWWTQYPSRSTAVPVSITHANGQTQTTVNQQTSGSRWNSLGQFTFNNSGTVTLSAPLAYPTSYCADAVRFVKLTEDTFAADFTASPVSGNAPLTVNFTDLSLGAGIWAWRWDFDYDGTIDSMQQNPTFTYTQPGTYTVRLIVFANGTYSEMIIPDFISVAAAAPSEQIIVDNGSSNTTSWGTWGVSGGDNPYGANSLWARETAGYRWYVTPQQGGTYRVNLWWTDYYSRGTQIPVTITHRDGTANLTVNQQYNGGKWNAVGNYRMLAGQTYYIQLNTAGDGSTVCADAVRIERISD